MSASRTHLDYLADILESISNIRHVMMSFT